jgi:hypothetical protein
MNSVTNAALHLYKMIGGCSLHSGAVAANTAAI